MSDIPSERCVGSVLLDFGSAYDESKFSEKDRETIERACDTISARWQDLLQGRDTSDLIYGYAYVLSEVTKKGGEEVHNAAERVRESVIELIDATNSTSAYATRAVVD